MAANDLSGAKSSGARHATKSARCSACMAEAPSTSASGTVHGSTGVLRRDPQLAVAGAFAVVTLCILGLLALRYALAPSQPPGPDIVTEQDAGRILDVHLQSAALGSETTVRTSLGIYQVRGGVSIAIGDEAKLRRTTNEMDGKPFRSKLELCVESKIKTGCYELL